MIKVLSYHILQYTKSVCLPDWVVDEGVELVSPVAVVRKPLQMNHKYLRQFPQVEFLGGLLMLLTRWTIPATIRRGSLKLPDKQPADILRVIFQLSLVSQFRLVFFFHLFGEENL